MAGMFSSDPARPLQADAAGLRGVVGDRLAEAFQVSPANPLVGVDGRLVLLRRLGEVLHEQPGVFGTDVQRPGGLFDMLVKPYGDTPPTADVAAHDILSQLLMSLSPIWPAQTCAGHGAAGRLLAPQRRARPGPDRRLDALSQAVAMAHLFFDRAV
jgi:hypothetical protein